MSICEEGLSYISQSRLDFIDCSSRILESIRNHLYENADFGNITRDADLHFTGSGRSLRVDSTYRIVELEEEDLLESEGHRYPPGTLRGVYNPNYGKIFLNKCFVDYP